ncbi:hypothetical protein [Microbacterium hominis]|uniref:Uncharacterized protein n=1 Tax=Microbacterium hominis TaxID=162426 RepID=A0A7D4UA76_9MICO|nr:hypothetical protein [Microbacterium hominis]QKJ18143.1 hypothetical protein HQM25_01080 [Microbacterium hominis]
MPTKTPLHAHRDPADAAILASILALAILAGIWPIAGVLTTWMPLLAVPAAAGLPSLLPPLRLVPLGGTTAGFWVADTLAVLVMLLAAWLQLRAVGRRRPNPGHGRAFGRGVWTTAVAVVAGNLVRTVFLSFVTHSDLGTFAGYVVFGMLVSLITGLTLGVVVGAAAAVTRLLRPRARESVAV